MTRMNDMTQMQGHGDSFFCQIRACVLVSLWRSGQRPIVQLGLSSSRLPAQPVTRPANGPMPACRGPGPMPQFCDARVAGC